MVCNRAACSANCESEELQVYTLRFLPLLVQTSKVGWVPHSVQLSLCLTCVHHMFISNETSLRLKTTACCSRPRFQCMLYSISAITNFIASTAVASAATAAAAIVFVIVSNFLLHFIFSLSRNPLAHTHTPTVPQSPINHLCDSHTHGGFYPTCQSISEV